MKKRTLYLTLTASLLALATPASAQVYQKIETSSSGGDSSVSVNSTVNGSSTTTYSNSGSNTVSIHTSGGDTNQVTINNNDFKITGTISALSGDSITVSNQKILIDKSKVSNFSQSGDLKVGNKVTVSGKVISGTLYAEKITADGTSNSSTPNPSTSANSQININLNNNNSSSPSATPSASPEVPPATKNAIQQLINTLENLINNLKSIFKV